jgi:hypothetical protein
VALRASFVSQETSLQLLGVDSRRYLELVVPLCKGAVVSLGKLRLVPLDDAEAALRRLAANDGASGEEGCDEERDGGQPETVDAVLAALGRVRSK